MASNRRHSRINRRDNGYTQRRSIQQDDTKIGICTSPGWIEIRVMVMVALLSEGKYDVIISARDRKEEAKNLKSLRAELPVVGHLKRHGRIQRPFTKHASAG